jgi:hypothetical protein
MTETLPVVVGVTGHRDVRHDDIAALQKLVGEFFQELRGKHPHTPIVVLSALADGADRLVARVALAGGLDLLAPLPMSRHLYELDFDAESKDDFAQLLSQSRESYEIPMAAEEAELCHSGAARTNQFALLGDHLCEQSGVLLALWDGVPSTKPGGTADVVSRFRLQRNGKIYHIVTPRVSNPSPPDALKARWLGPPH